MKQKNVENRTPYSLLAKFFVKQCSLEEEKVISDWCNESVENELLFNQLQKEWIAARIDESKVVIPDQEQVWNQIQAKTHKKTNPIYTYSRRSMIRVASIAALFALLIGVGMTIWLTKPSHVAFEAQRLDIVAPPGQRMKLLLPDSTQVWLNSNSQITYYSDFNMSNRDIELKGEAFFEVTHLNDHPFTVHSEEVNVQVYGTKFNVKAREKDAELTVSLIEGSVRLLSSANHETITFLKPNQKAIVNKDNLSFSLLPCDARAESSWHLNLLYFDNLLAKEVWKKLEGWYGVKIHVENEPAGKNYRFKVKTESLTELLELINKINPITYEISGEEVTVRYK